VTEHAARTPADQAALVAIAEAVGAPVFEYWMPMYVNFPRAHPLYATDPIETHLNDADCILVIGAHGPWHPQETPLPDGCTVIHIEEDPLRPRAPYWGFRTDYCIAGDIGSNLAQLAALLQAQPRAAEVTSRTERWRAHNAASNAEAAKEREAAHSGERIHAALLFDTLHIRGWAGALGTGLPTALGVKLARPKDVVVCVIGDGAFNYNPVPACLGLAQQYGVPVLVIICNNQGYVSQEWNLYKYFPSGYALRDNNPYGRVIEPTPDYAAIAPAFGAHGECVTEPGQLEPAISRAIDAVQQGRLALLDVRLEP
jgi:acetolactate synthase I/II/III large subunit